jgi:hypothetical protein
MMPLLVLIGFALVAVEAQNQIILTKKSSEACRE